MRRKPADDDAGAMDSLLDTMTNVVGILVIVLVVTQLGVGEAVERVSKDIKVDIEKLEENKNRLTEIEQKRTILRAQMELLDPATPIDEDALDQQIAELQSQINKDDLLLKNLQKKNITDEQNLARGKAEKEAEAEKRKQLELEIKTSLGSIAKLRATLDSTPERQFLPTKTTKMPDPRPAPEGLKPLTMICYQNRILPFDFYQFQLAARKKAEEIIKKNGKKLIVNQKDGIDAERFIKAFQRKPLRNEFFDIEMMSDAQGVPRLRLRPRKNAGADLKDVEKRSSRFAKDMKQINPRTHYLRFFVCGDSYEVYLSGRAVAEAQNINVGWIPQPKDWMFIGNMGGDLRFGNFKTSPPAKPNPNQPPKKPQNVID